MAVEAAVAREHEVDQGLARDDDGAVRRAHVAAAAGAISPEPARHQLGGHDDQLRLAVEAVEPREEQLGGAPAEPERILRDDRDAGVHHVRKHDVVEADERRLVLHAAVAQRADRADRDEVLRGEERRRGIGGEQQLARRRLGGSAVDEPDALERRLRARCPAPASAS